MTATDALQIFNSLSAEQREAFVVLALNQGEASSTPARNRTSANTSAGNARRGSNTVATTTTRKSAAAKAKAKTAAKKTAAKASTAKATTNGKSTTTKEETAAKRAAAKAANDKLRAEVVQRRENDEKWGDIASDLNITSGKAQFLHMQHDVAEGTVPAITFRNDDELVKKAVAAREKQDTYSSWGWIAARTGVAEGRIKALVEKSGVEVKGTNIAVARGAAKAATKTNGQTKTGQPKSGAASSAKAKAKAAKSAKRRPSSRA